MIHTLGFNRRAVFALVAGILALGVSGCAGNTTPAVVVTPTLTIVNGGASTGKIGVTFSGSLTVSGGTTPYYCSGGGLPSGLTVNSNCTITGIPGVGTYGTTTFTAFAQDSSSTTREGEGLITLTIQPTTLVLPSAALKAAGVGIPYSVALAVSGGETPYTCSVGAQTVPGLTLNSNCTVTGTPTAAGNYSYAVTAKDAETPAQTATATLTLSVTQPSAHVMAGQLPVIGGTVQLYAAGTAGNGSTPTALLASPLLTGISGGFLFPSTGYTCPTPTSIVYAVETGGQAGTNGTVNPGTMLMTVIGPCSAIATTVNLVINEATTVASAYAMSQFMKTGAQVGATATNLMGITLAANTMANLVNPSTGLVSSLGQASPTTGTTTQAIVDLLADAVNACLTASNPSSTCSYLYAAAKVNSVEPTNTLDAIMNLAQHPATSTAPVFSLASASSVYAPVPTVAPSDWTLYVNYVGGGMSDPSAVSIDSQGRVWVASYAFTASLFTNLGVPVFANGVTGNGLEFSYGGAVDASDNFWQANEEGGPYGIGTVTVLNKSGVGVSGSPYSQGGLNFPIAVSIDTNTNAWIADYGDSSVTLLTAAGTPLSGGAGYSASNFEFPVAIAVDTNHNAWLANQATNTITEISPAGTGITSYVVGGGPSGIAIDAKNNVWSANYYNDAIGLVSSAGKVVSPTGGFAGGGVVHPQGIAVDGSGNVWVTNYRGPSLSELSGASTSTPGAAISPATGFGTDAQLLEAFGIAIDASGNVWVTNFGNNTLTEFIGLAAPVKTPLIGVVATP